MNRASAAFYALCIGTRPPDFHKQLEAVARDLADEVERLSKIVDDPFIRGYLEARRLGCFQSNGNGNG